MEMIPKDELSQVVFIDDYFQLVFQDVYFTVLTPPTLVSRRGTYCPGDPGFCDELVGLISSTATAIELNATDDLSITFATGAKLSVLASDTRAIGTEAWRFGRAGVPCYIALTR